MRTRHLEVSFGSIELKQGVINCEFCGEKMESWEHRDEDGVLFVVCNCDWGYVEIDAGINRTAKGKAVEVERFDASTFLYFPLGDTK